MLNIEGILTDAKNKLKSVNNIESLNKVKVDYLGKKGQLTEALKNLSTVDPLERPKFGKIVNDAKNTLTELIELKLQELEAASIKSKLESETIDVTLPGRNRTIGSLHPITKTFYRIEEHFLQLGFSIAYGPEIENEYNNFEALNIPKHHPARAMHDTFYFDDGLLLRTHTSNVQIRVMQNNKPPFRLIAPGRVYRCDSDITHTPMFHQVEGLMIEKGINFSHLKGVFTRFLQAFFEKDLKIRFRPSYFPFTEPSAEVDMQCTGCMGGGCRICKNTGWLEISGCGMVHPNVLKNCNIDPNEYSGFAFGMGADRLAMLRYGINDLRINFENDLRFLQQF